MMTDRVAVVGATGFLGTALVLALAEAGVPVTMVARRPPHKLPAAAHFVPCDGRNGAALAEAVRGAGRIVNAVAGPPATIEQVARGMLEACNVGEPRRLVHISSLAVFGQTRGTLDEATEPAPARWHRYGIAKRNAERMLLNDRVAERGCVILRPGCIYGPGAPVWSDRIGRLLLAGRLGWLGREAAGWCTAVHVADVTRAVLRALEFSDATTGIHHVVAPDEITWNGYFRRFGAALELRALQPTGRVRLMAESLAVGPALRLRSKLDGRDHDIISPSMRRVFRTRALPVARRRPLVSQDEFVTLEEGLEEAAVSLLSRTVGVSRGRRSTLSALAGAA